MFYFVQLFSNWFVYSFLGLRPDILFSEVINFFVYDTIKIFILLVLIIFIVSVTRSYLPPEKIRSILSRKNKYLGNIFASLFGIVTPFCTCSAIPLFLGFIQAGVPLGTTFSFLISSPMINEVALVLLFGLFGWKIALVYVLSGLLISIISGILIGKLKLENLIEPYVYQNNINIDIKLLEISRRERFAYASDYTKDIIKKVWPYILIGVGLGAWIHGYMPADFLATYASSNKWYAVPLAVIIGIPLYSSAAGVIPLVSALTEKGVAMGTTLAFMMSVTALSLPEFMILKRVMKVRLILIFTGIVGLGIIFTGYLFNLIL